MRKVENRRPSTAEEAKGELKLPLVAVEWLAADVQLAILDEYVDPAIVQLLQFSEDEQELTIARAQAIDVLKRKLYLMEVRLSDLFVVMKMAGVIAPNATVDLEPRS